MFSLEKDLRFKQFKWAVQFAIWRFNILTKHVVLQPSKLYDFNACSPADLEKYANSTECLILDFD